MSCEQETHFFSYQSVLPFVEAAWQEIKKCTTATLLTHTQTIVDPNCTNNMEPMQTSQLWPHFQTKDGSPYTDILTEIIYLSCKNTSNKDLN